MNDSLRWIDDELAQLDARTLRRVLTVRETPQVADAIVLDGQQLINFGSNDYLGFAPLVSNAVADALQETGWGSGASPLISGRARRHAELETALADFEGTEAALLFPTGFAANLGTIGALVGKGDILFSDAKNHASIVDGSRLSGARIQIYPHGDMDYLHKMLQQAGGFRRRLIVTDSLFSMDGDLAKLAELAMLARQFDCMLMVDEAHATGVFGELGKGVCEHLGVEDAVDIRVGTLSKALGSVGGFVAGSQKLIDWLANRARSYVFSTAYPEAVAAAGLAALRLLRSEPQRRTRLLATARELRQSLAAQGWRAGESPSQIIPVYLGDAEAAVQASRQLREEGLFVPAIRPPSVPAGESLLRISLSCGHTTASVEQLKQALARLA